MKEHEEDLARVDTTGNSSDSPTASENDATPAITFDRIYTDLVRAGKFDELADIIAQRFRVGR